MIIIIKKVIFCRLFCRFFGEHGIIMSRAAANEIQALIDGANDPGRAKLSQWVQGEIVLFLVDKNYPQVISIVVLCRIFFNLNKSHQ
jgi:hypothetical protein